MSPSAMHRFDLAATPAMAWKNGGGTTREIACWPPGAGLDGFGWRVSVAAVEQGGPFSVFPGVDRHILWLAGGGLHLRSQDGAIDRLLQAPRQPFAFAGEAALDCTLPGGPSQDFNLMLRRVAWRGSIELQRHAVLPGTSAAGLCMVLEGRWRQGDAGFSSGQGLWWSEPGPAGALQPEPGALLAWVALARVPSPWGIETARSA